MLDVVETQKILEDYFANVTPEQFMADLKNYCPELLESESAELDLEKLEKTRIYQQAKQESRVNALKFSIIENTYKSKVDLIC
jgi:hypothetical protein